MIRSIFGWVCDLTKNNIHSFDKNEILLAFCEKINLQFYTKYNFMI